MAETMPTEFAVITLIIPITASWPRPDKTSWNELIDHDGPILVRDCEYMESRDLLVNETDALKTYYEETN